MIPCDLEAKNVEFPATDKHEIVLYTDAAHGELLCERFALRMQQEFGERVVAWYQFYPSQRTTALPPLLSRVRSFIKRELKLIYQRPSAIFSWFHKSPTVIGDRIAGRDPLSAGQERFLGEEARSWKSVRRLPPIRLGDTARTEFVAQLQHLKPYFFLSLGEPPNMAELRPAVRGILLNQHVGWCPEYRGPHAVYWAMYHRDLMRIGATIHEMAGEANAGPIFRRASACLLPTDDTLQCYLRSAVLGSELMCETVNEIMTQRRAAACEQPLGKSTTHRTTDLDREVRRRIRDDFSGHWLGAELRRSRDY